MVNPEHSTGVTIELVGDTCTVTGVLDFTTAGQAMSAVVPCIRKIPQLRIDLAAVTLCNSAGLALMIEWLAEARRNTHSVTFSSVPDALQQLSRVCQVDGLI